MWGRGYLRRQRVDKKPDNAAGGTLTGTYFSICALSGYLGPHHLSGLYPLTDSLKQHIRTLLSTKDGTYLKNYEFTGTPRVEIPVSEAPRHTAAGLMLRLLFRDADERDEKTVRWLATRVLLQPENGDPVDIAFAARAVLAFHYEASTPGCLWGKDIHEAYTLGVQQLVSLSSEKDIRMVWAPRSGTHPGFDNSRFGAPIYQWTVVWALLPILQDTAFASREDQSAIESVIIRLTREQLSCRHDRNTLFAERWDPRQDRSGGESLFCTCVALASLSLLHARPSPTEEINRQVVELARVLSDFDTSRLCSVSKDSEEGYLAYAATLLASSTLSGQANARDLDDARAILTELQRERNESGDLLRSAHSTPRGSTTNLSDLEQTLRPEELRMVAELISQRETEFREHFPRKLMDEASS